MDARKIKIDDTEPYRTDDADCFTVILPDKRKWLFQVPTKRDLGRWLHAFHSQHMHL